MRSKVFFFENTFCLAKFFFLRALPCKVAINYATQGTAHTALAESPGRTTEPSPPFPVCLVEWMAPTSSERTFFSSVWMKNGGGWSRSEMEYSQHMRVGPVRQNLADEFDLRGFRPSRDGRRLLPRVRHRRGGRSGGAQFRAETGRRAEEACAVLVQVTSY